jgi:hypothetical protein
MATRSWLERAAMALEASRSNKPGFITYNAIADANSQGRLFVASHIFTTITNGGNADFGVTIGSDEVNILPVITTTGIASFLTYDSPTFTGGTEVTGYALNRTYGTNGSHATVVRTPTVSDTGTLILQELIPGADKSKGGGGSSQNLAQLILPAEGVYLFRVTNTSGHNMSASIDLYYHI